MNQKKLLITLTSLCAEGTPILTLEMCRFWLKYNIQPSIVTWYPTPTDLLSEFEKLGIPLLKCFELSNRDYRRYLKIVTNTYEISRSMKPDALLCMPFGWHAFCAWGARLAGVPQIAAHVGVYPVAHTALSFAKFRFEVQLGRPVTNQLICCSHYVREGVIKKFGISQSETRVIYNGCPIENIVKRAVNQRSSPEKQSVFKMGMVARIDKTKDHPILIEAARLLKERGLKFVVWLIGEGSHRIEYEALVKDWQLEDCVKFLGMRRDVPELLGQLDLFVYSVKFFEGLGVALIEAMAVGVPVVATDVPACREVLDEGELGILVPPESPERMADAIFHAIAHPEETQQRVEKARQKVFREFTIEKMAKSYAQCLGLIK